MAGTPLAKDMMRLTNCLHCAALIRLLKRLLCLNPT